MLSELNEKVDAAIAKMFDQVKASQDGQKALHFSQSAQNLAHTKSILNAMQAASSTAPQASEQALPAVSKKS